MWLSRTAVPLFISRTRLTRKRRLPRAVGTWALDSGGFTQVTGRGGWDDLTPRAYVAEVRRFRDDVGGLRWAAPQDWMCEPVALAATGLDVAEHQRRTTVNFLELRSLAPDLPIIPVLQGWTADDYRRHLDDYDRAGVQLMREPTVGLGTVCRRQGTADAVAIVRAVHGAAPGIRLHGFGFKTRGLAQLGDELASADSMAWSFRARHAGPPVDHVHDRGAASCASCMIFALAWRARLVGGEDDRRPAGWVDSLPRARPAAIGR